jgi:hypothetical protein
MAAVSGPSTARHPSPFRQVALTPPPPLHPPFQPPNGCCLGSIHSQASLFLQVIAFLPHSLPLLNHPMTAVSGLSTLPPSSSSSALQWLLSQVYPQLGIPLPSSDCFSSPLSPPQPSNGCCLMSIHSPSLFLFLSPPMAAISGLSTARHPSPFK